MASNTDRDPQPDPEPDPWPSTFMEPDEIGLSPEGWNRFHDMIDMFQALGQQVSPFLMHLYENSGHLREPSQCPAEYAPYAQCSLCSIVATNEADGREFASATMCRSCFEGASPQ